VDLQAAINRYIAEHNDDPRPFVWTKPAKLILDKINRHAEPPECGSFAPPLVRLSESRFAALSGERPRVRGSTTGADDYLRKPEVDPGIGTRGIIGTGAVSVVVDGDDNEEAKTED
jgi:hypothetical protein